MRDSDHPIEEDTAFQTRVWKIQRIAWAIFMFIPLVALTGFFAKGYLSDTATGNIHSLAINYERFQRITKLARFTFHIAAGQPRALRLNTAFQHAYVIENIQPLPLRSTADREGLYVTFDKPPGQPLVVELWVKPQTFGWFEIEAQSGDKSLSFPVFIYP